MSQPVISVIVEGYNESRELGKALETIEALKKQDFPLEQIEIILVGSEQQTQEWNKLYSGETCFFSLKTVDFDNAHYYELKNGGAGIASGEIIAFTDSDVHPKLSWVSTIVEGIRNGADVVVGPSLFRQEGGFSPDSPLMRVLASITWGWVVGKGKKDGDLLLAAGFMDHNVALKASLFGDHKYRTDLGRVCASPLLYRDLANAGLKIVLQSKQQAAHFFSWDYWLIKLHFRYGYEVYQLRRLDKQYPNQWIAQTKILEPLVTMAWHVLLDIPRWFRFSSLLGTNIAYRLSLLPLVIGLSTIARGAEMVGMYSTMLTPDNMKQWAQNV
jgi:glycosyltransferase involved in cell wall biosynthesis